MAGNFAALMRRFAREGAQMIDPAASAARASGRTPANHDLAANAAGRTPANHDLAANAAGRFRLDQAGQEPDMILTLGRAPRADARRMYWRRTPPGAGRSCRIPVRQGRQLRCLQTMRQQDLRGLGHAASAAIRHI